MSTFVVLMIVLGILGLILLVVVIVAMIGIGIYNSLVTLRNSFKNQYAQIDVELKRRHDLIPNLVETAKGYMAHERGTLEAVIAARNGAATARQRSAADPTDAQAVNQMLAAEGALTQSLGKLFAVAEAYPDLKANQNMMAIQGQLTETENRVAMSRESYNESVRAYNTAREIFPNTLIAGFCNFAAATLFEITDPGEREVPKVAF